MTNLGTRIAIESTGAQANTKKYFVASDTTIITIVLPKMKLNIARNSLLPV
jgi:hypothetical protein